MKEKKFISREKKASQKTAHDIKPFRFKNTKKHKFNFIPKEFHWFGEVVFRVFLFVYLYYLTPLK